MDETWHPNHEFSTSRDTCHTMELRPRKRRPEYEMTIFLENLVEHPVPVVEHETVVSSPRVNFESVLSLCTQTNGSGISHDGAQEESPHVVETNMLQEEQSHVVGTNTLQEEQCPSACSDITSEGRKKGTSFRRREQFDEMEVLLARTTRQNQKAKNRQRRRKGLAQG